MLSGARQHRPAFHARAAGQRSSPALYVGLLTRRELYVVIAVLAIVLGTVAWVTFLLLKPMPPRHIVLATGVADGI